VDNPYEQPRAPLDRFADAEMYKSVPERPSAITVFGVLNIIYGGIGVICNPIIAVGNAIVTGQAGQAGNPILDKTLDPGYRQGGIVFAVLSTIACAVLLLAGIGLLTSRRWGRTLSMGYGFYEILHAVAFLVFNYIFILGPIFAESRQANTPEATANAVGGAVGMIGVILVAMIYPVVLLIFMKSERVTRFFAKQESEAQAGQNW
jgi:hypothetical protein